MQNSHGPGPKPGSLDRYAIRVLRLDPKEVFLVRVLAASYSGLLTHWMGKRGEYCPGVNQCPRNQHARPIIWKGYFAAEIWDQSRKLWFPTVVELTEGCELDMRGQFQRGQTWELSKPADTDKTNPPLIARLHETSDASNWPSAFHINPVVATLYHVPTVKIDLPNPMPAKVLAVPSQGPAPAARDGASEISPEENAKVREMISAFANRFKTNGGGK